ncbi:MAG: hypothetical protein AAFY17_07625, partial [Cyanobacteria bacterium J06642_11]
MNSLFHTLRGARRAVALFLIVLTTVVGLHTFPLVESASAQQEYNGPDLLVYEYRGSANRSTALRRYPYVRPNEDRENWRQRHFEARRYEQPTYIAGVYTILSSRHQQ